MKKWIKMVRLLALTLPVAVPADDFTYITNADNTLTITKYTGSAATVTIPAVINGLAVTRIGGRVESFPDDYTSGAFYNANATNVVIPNSVTNIGRWAFALSGLTAIRIPDAVTSIEVESFSNCLRLRAIMVGESNAYYSSVDGVLFNKTRTALIQYPRNRSVAYYVIPDTVTSIGYEAFSGCRAAYGITLPNGITSIGEWAFSYCTSQLNLPDSVTNIGMAAFTWCNLTSVNIPSGTTVIESESFSHCLYLTNAIISEGVTCIGVSAFQDCSRLVSVTIPDSVTNIGDGAFQGCTSLTNVIIPGSVTCIGSNAFYNTGLTGIYFMGDAPTTSGGLNVTSDVYYLPSTAGWPSFFNWSGIRPSVWKPQLRPVTEQTNGFSFKVNWASGMTVVVEACTNLAEGIWIPVETNTLTGGSAQFSDPAWTNHPNRYYRVSMPQ